MKSQRDSDRWRLDYKVTTVSSTLWGGGEGEGEGGGRDNSQSIAE